MNFQDALTTELQSSKTIDYRTFLLSISFHQLVTPLIMLNATVVSLFFPGIPRKTPEEKEFGDFSIFEDPEAHYSTFNFHYLPKPFDRLEKLNEFNTLLGENTIKNVMVECVRRRRERKAMNGKNGMNGMNGH